MRSISEGEELAVCVVDVTSELSSIQLLPQQASMLSALPNAIINKDIFPCTTCGIWFRSDRNLQAHLVYYCSGRPRKSELASDKQNNTNHQMSLTCIYPQCNLSFLGPQALKMHLSTHSVFSTEETSPGSSLKCTICDYTADTLMVLQPHILTHLSQTGLRCSQCHFTFQTSKDLEKHQDQHRLGVLDSYSTNKKNPDNLESCVAPNQADNKSTAGSPIHSNMQQDNNKQVQGTSETEVGIGGNVAFSYSRVKSEPSSPQLASSPIQNHMTPPFSMLPLMPPFSQDNPTIPQASEILAKMSELVHRRLRHGGNGLPPVMYGTLIPKGVTCFECNIMFSNIDNYLVHKKHYCTNRWQQMSKSYEYGILDKSTGSPKAGRGLASMLNAGHSFEVKSPSQFSMSVVEALATGGKAPEECTENAKKAVAPSEVEDNPNNITSDSKNIIKSDSESDPNQTTCEACKITFSRLENYSVHKQYYCASRHDPPAKRPANNRHVQKSCRTRKRKKSSDPGTSQFYPSDSSYKSQNTVESLKDVLNQRYNMIQGLDLKQPDASLTVTKSALVPKFNVIAEGEGDAPIDLSKKCIVQFSKISGVMDYHECTVCKVSFNKVEDYLSHKKNSCPGAALENEAPNLLEEKNPPGFSVILEHSVQVNTSVPAAKQLPVKDKHSVMDSDSYPIGAKKIRADEQIWPYYEIKPATGIFCPQKERRQITSETTEDEKEQGMSDSSYFDSEEIDHPAINFLKSSFLGDDKQETESCSTLASSPNLCFMACTTDQENTMKTKEHITFLPASKTNEISGLQRSINRSVSAVVKGKYCRPCDIQFNNLSNFITHKKFYCSAQTAEHVK